MPDSYRKIDYRLRPAKSVERKMFVEAFRRLAPFARVDSYRYVGFGSVYFSDFSLFHRALGFVEMISIEATDDVTVQSRFEFNRPYNSIKMRFGYSQTVLPRLSWEPRTIFWLDYDTTLTLDVLGDVSTICNKAAPGSVLIVTVCIPRPGAIKDSEENDIATPIELLKKKLGADLVPPNLESKDLAGWGMAAVYRMIISNQIQEALKQRNGVLPQNSKIGYDQIFNFRYADGMKILTVGGILYDEGQRNVLASCGFSDLEFYCSGDDFYEIETPLLTFREMRAIERDFPDGMVPAQIPIDKEDIDKFRRIYRFFPTFAEADV